MILYVEDNDENWEVAQLYLTRYFELLRARSDIEACATLKKHTQIAAILMDIELQGSNLNGIELTRLIRGHLADKPVPHYAKTVPLCKRTPIFFVTAYSARYSENVLRHAGGNKLISKPVNFGEVSSALMEVTLSWMTAQNSPLQRAVLRGEARPTALIGILAEDRQLVDQLQQVTASLVESPAEDSQSGRTLRSVIVCFALLKLLPADPLADKIIANCLRRGVAARLIGQQCGLPVDQCFLLGFMLDVGLFARARYDLQGAIEVAVSPAGSRPMREQIMGEASHAVTGAEIARAWSLDDALAAAIQSHHQTSSPDTPLGRVAWLAEQLAAAFEPGYHPRAIIATTAAAESLGIPATVVDEFMSSIPREVAKYADLMGCSLLPQDNLDLSRQRSSHRLDELDQSYQHLINAVTSLVEEKDALAERLRSANDILSEQAVTDPLTGILNRRAFDEALHRELIRTQRSQSAVSLILLDIDHFKSVNDTHGHAAGDLVLRHLAQQLRAGMRTSDVLARIGGEEFALLLLDTEDEKARSIAERLRQQVEQDFRVSIEESTTIRVTVSLGCASLTTPVQLDTTVATAGRSPDVAAMARELFVQADQSLYRAKRTGRNRVSGPLSPSE